MLLCIAFVCEIEEKAHLIFHMELEKILSNKNDYIAKLFTYSLKDLNDMEFLYLPLGLESEKMNSTYSKHVK
jgi:hypothetical protein